MGLGRSFFVGIRRPFTNFERLLAGLFLTIVPIINFFSFGYLLQCAKNQEYELPPWNKMGEKFSLGFVALLVMLIYLIPIIIYISASYSTGGLIRDILLQNFSNFGLIFEETNQIILGIAVVYLLFLSYLMPFTLYKLFDGFRECFKMKKLINETFTSKYFKVWILGLLVLISVNYLFIKIPVIGLPFGSFVAAVVFYTMLGSEYNGE